MSTSLTPEVREVLTANVLGRLAFLEHDHPVVLPVNYAMDGDSIVFRSAEGSKLDIAQNEVRSVAFEVDATDPSGAVVAVTIRGRMRAVLDLVEAAKLEHLDLDAWADAIRRATWVRITIDEAARCDLPASHGADGTG